MKYLKLFENFKEKKFRDGYIEFFDNWSPFDIDDLIDNEGKMEKKVIMNMFICRHESPNWSKCVEVLHSIKFPTTVEISGAHHRGLAVQVLLDTNLEESASFCRDLLDKFLPEVPLIVISEVNLQIKDSPIGQWFDDDLVQPGRYFDKLVSEEKNGLVIHDENTPKIIKKTDRNL